MKKRCYQVGGIVDEAEGHLYIARPADDELVRYLQNGTYCFILAPRQIGKSSLVHRARQRLQPEGIQIVYIDLQLFMKDGLDETLWYEELAQKLEERFRPSRSANNLLGRYPDLAPSEQWRRYLLDLLFELPERQAIVIVLDEIDETRRLGFQRDDFFAAIRGLHNARPYEPRLKRLTFCLVGVATPAELIEAEDRTPFNVARGIELHDFTREEAAPLCELLSTRFERAEAEALFEEVYAWTEGHPYWMQLLCDKLAHGYTEEARDRGSAAGRVEALVQDNLLRRRTSQTDLNIDAALRIFRHRYLGLPPQKEGEARRHLPLKDPTEIRRRIALYRELLEGRPIPVQEQDAGGKFLLLTGMVTSREEDGRLYLRLRNRVFARYFDSKWLDGEARSKLVTERLQQLEAPRPWSEELETWLRSGRNKQWLLAGEVLDQASKWLRGNRDDMKVRNEERDFIFESVAAEEEKTRIHLAEEQRRLATEKRRSRRLGSLTIVLAVTSILTIAISTETVKHRRRQELRANAIKHGREATVASANARQVTVLINGFTHGMNAVRAYLEAPDWNPVDGTPPEEQHDVRVLTPEGVRGVAGILQRIVPSRELRLDMTTACQPKFLESSDASQPAKEGPPLDGLSISPDGWLIAAWSGDCVVVRELASLALRGAWSLANNQLEGSIDKVLFLSSRPDSELLVVSDSEQPLTLLRLRAPTTGMGNDRVTARAPSSFLVLQDTPIGAVALDLMAMRLGSATVPPSSAPPPQAEARFRSLAYYFALVQAAKEHQSNKPEAELSLLNLATWRLLDRAVAKDGNTVRIVAFANDGTRFVTTSEDGVTKLWTWDGMHARELPILLNHESAVLAAAFSPDGQRVVTASADGVARVWAADTGNRMVRLWGHDEALTVAAFSSQGERVLTASRDGTARIWDAQTGDPLLILVGHQGPIRAAAFMAADTQVITASDDGTARLWELTAQVGLQEVELSQDAAHTSEIRTICIGPDSQQLAIEYNASSPVFKQVHQSKSGQWSVGPGQNWGSGPKASPCLPTDARPRPVTQGDLEKYRKSSMSYYMSVSGRRLITASTDHTARIWDLKGRLLFAIQHRSVGLSDAVLSPDERWLALLDEHRKKLFIATAQLDSLFREGCRLLGQNQRLSTPESQELHKICKELNEKSRIGR